MAAARISSERIFNQALHIIGLLRDHIPERPPPLLLSLRFRPPPVHQTLTLDFAEPRYQPVLEITAEDLAPFSPRDWEAFLAPLTAASPSPSSAEKTVSASPSPSKEARPFPVEVALLIALAGATVLFAALAIKHGKMRRRVLRGGGGESGGGWGRRRLGGDPMGLISLLPRRGEARLTRRHPLDEAVRLSRAAEADGAAWLARLAASGTLGRDNADLELLQRVVLQVRQALHSRLPQESHLSSFLKKCVGINPVLNQASVPEWKNAPSVEETEDYRAATLTQQGTIVCALNMDISATGEPEKARKEFVDSCNCSHPGSEDCVRVHVTKARIWIKGQLGEGAFKNCGLDAMGEQVGELWTTVDKRKLEDVGKSLPQNKHRNFMDITKKLSPKETKDIAKYYYNVFLPRRLASLTRAEHKKDEAVDTADESSSTEE